MKKLKERINKALKWFVKEPKTDWDVVRGWLNHSNDYARLCRIDRSANGVTIIKTVFSDKEQSVEQEIKYEV